MLKKISLIFIPIFTAVLLSGCSGIKPTPIQTSQHMETNLARLILPLSDEVKETQIVRLSTGQLDSKLGGIFMKFDMLIEQHAFKGGRVTAIFDDVSTSPILRERSIDEILPRIKDSAYVKDYLGENRILGKVKKMKHTSIVDTSYFNIQGAGGIRYAMVKNPKKTRYCTIFSMFIFYSEGSEVLAWVPIVGPLTQDHHMLVIDGALCDNSRNKNIHVMEAYAKRFISSINIQKY